MSRDSPRPARNILFSPVFLPRHFHFGALTLPEYRSGLPLGADVESLRRTWWCWLWVLGAQCEPFCGGEWDVHVRKV